MPRGFWMGLIGIAAVGAAASPALAHAGHDQHSFGVGFMHPLHGLDHLLAMVTVGLLSSRMEPRRMWMLPLAFVAMMGAGGLLGLVFAGEGLAVFEWGITLSVIVFGVVAAMAPRVPLIGGHVIVAAFAVCHGHAHVAEMADASAWGYFPGMLAATGVLHLAGLIAGVLMKQHAGEWAVRAAGGAVAAAFTAIVIHGLL